MASTPQFDTALSSYLRKHGLQDILNELVNDVLVQKPEDPLKALAQLLIDRSEGNKSNVENELDLGPTNRAPVPGEIRGGFTIKNTKRVYENPWIHVREDQVIRADGKPGIYGVITMKNWALGVVPLFADGTILLVGQHRYPHNEYSWEIPEGGGKLGGDPLDEIKRELKEEAGITANKWTPLGPLTTSNSVVDETGYVWLAEDLTEGEPDPDGDEVLNHRRIPIQQAIKEIQSGKIHDAITVIGVYRAFHLLHTREKKMPWPAYDLSSNIPVSSTLVPFEGPIKKINNYWFGIEQLTPNSNKSYWFERTSESDQTIKERFESEWRMAAKKHYENWDETPEGCLAKVLLCGIFPRRIFKDQPASYATDQIAIATAQKAIEKGFDKKLHFLQKLFLILGLQYSESIDLQQKCVQMLDNLSKETIGTEYSKKIDPQLR